MEKIYLDEKGGSYILEDVLVHSLENEIHLVEIHLQEIEDGHYRVFDESYEFIYQTFGVQKWLEEERPEYLV